MREAAATAFKVVTVKLALELFARDSRSLLGRAVVHVRLGNRKQALSDLGKAVSLNSRLKSLADRWIRKAKALPQDR